MKMTIRITNRLIHDLRSVDRHVGGLAGLGAVEIRRQHPGGWIEHHGEVHPAVFEKLYRRCLADFPIESDRGAEAGRARHRPEPGGRVLPEVKERTRRAGGQVEPGGHAERVFAGQRGARQLQVAAIARQHQRPPELVIVDERRAVAAHRRMELVPRGVFGIAVEHIPRDQSRLADAVEELVAALRLVRDVPGAANEVRGG